METALPTIVLVIIAIVASIVLSGLIIKTAKALARFLIFTAVLYIMLQVFGLI